MTNLTAHEEAIGWTIRLRDPVSADWEGFTAWLEADPRNRNAYDDAMLADADMVQVSQDRDKLSVQNAPANDNQPGIFRRFGGIAAAVLIALVAYPVYQVIFPTYSIETALGEQRGVTLDDGTVITMNGGTRLTFDRRNTRLALLDKGEAQFRVSHDAQNPFTVQVGDVRVQDAGTVFNIAREAEQTDISVAEGLVLFNPARDALLLKPGQRLRLADAGAAPVISSVNPALVGGWTSGRLNFTAETLADVAPDLSRVLGQTISVEQAIAAQQFTGTIIIDRKDDNAIQKVAALMGVTAHKADNGWQLTAN